MKPLSVYKKENRYTFQDLSDKFGVPFQTMVYWVGSDNVFIKGPINKKQIIRRNADELLAVEGE